MSVRYAYPNAVSAVRVMKKDGSFKNLWLEPHKVWAVEDITPALVRKKCPDAIAYKFATNTHPRMFSARFVERGLGKTHYRELDFAWGGTITCIPDGTYSAFRFEAIGFDRDVAKRLASEANEIYTNRWPKLAEDR